MKNLPCALTIRAATLVAFSVLLAGCPNEPLPPVAEKSDPTLIGVALEGTASNERPQTERLISMTALPVAPPHRPNAFVRLSFKSGWDRLGIQYQVQWYKGGSDPTKLEESAWVDEGKSAPSDTPQGHICSIRFRLTGPEKDHYVVRYRSTVSQYSMNESWPGNEKTGEEWSGLANHPGKPPGTHFISSVGVIIERR